MFIQCRDGSGAPIIINAANTTSIAPMMKGIQTPKGVVPAIGAGVQLAVTMMEWKEGTSISRFIHPDDTPRVWALFQAMARETEEQYVRFVNGNGRGGGGQKPGPPLVLGDGS